MKKQVLTFLFILFIQWFSNAQKLSRIEKKIVKKVQTMDNQDHCPFWGERISFFTR